MQDARALQAGTSHFLGQNFAKAFDVKFMNENNQEAYVWATSWGVSTRLVGGLIMTHSDDEGLVLPPKLAPLQVIIVPIPKPAPEIGEVAEKIMKELRSKGISVEYDTDEKKRPGFKFAEYEMRGVPVRVGIGKRDLEKGQVEIARRDIREKNFVPIEGAADHVEELLEAIQHSLFEKALKFRAEHTTSVDDFDTFKEVVEEKGGFIEAHWDGMAETELKIKEETKATIRCIPINGGTEAGTCIYSGKPSKGRVLFAKAY
jgi:prolyl-tRNA synthetase